MKILENCCKKPYELYEPLSKSVQKIYQDENDRNRVSLHSSSMVFKFYLKEKKFLHYEYDKKIIRCEKFLKSLAQNKKINKIIQ